jgi:AhpD family alkylhydroperoxidase
MSHDTRLKTFEIAPESANALSRLSHQLHKESTVGAGLFALVDSRVSQLNGCTFCLDMHAREWLAAGGDLQKLVCVAGWREAAFYTPRERAALAWAESLTRLGPDAASDAEYAELREHFNEREIVDLTLGCSIINAWNRINVGLRTSVAAKPIRA